MAFPLQRNGVSSWHVWQWNRDHFFTSLVTIFQRLEIERLAVSFIHNPPQARNRVDLLLHSFTMAKPVNQRVAESRARKKAIDPAEYNRNNAGHQAAHRLRVKERLAMTPAIASVTVAKLLVSSAEKEQKMLLNASAKKEKQLTSSQRVDKEAKA